MIESINVQIAECSNCGHRLGEADTGVLYFETKRECETEALRQGWGYNDGFILLCPECLDNFCPDMDDDERDSRRIYGHGSTK